MWLLPKFYHLVLDAEDIPGRNAYIDHIFSIFVRLRKTFGPQPQQTMAASDH